MIRVDELLTERRHRAKLLLQSELEPEVVAMSMTSRWTRRALCCDIEVMGRGRCDCWNDWHRVCKRRALLC